MWALVSTPYLDVRRDAECVDIAKSLVGTGEMLYNGSMQLAEGVQRFRDKAFEQRREAFAELANGQAPDVLFITCADSRVDPSLITQTEPGSLFVCRNAGNIVPAYGERSDGLVASVEYAVSVLGVSHAVVCGHSGCGAMGALLDPPPADALPSVQRWLAEARVIPDEDETIDQLIARNTVAQLANLRTHPSVDQALRAGSLELHAWVYDIGSGAVRSIAEDGTSTEVGT